MIHELNKELFNNVYKNEKAAQDSYVLLFQGNTKPESSVAIAFDGESIVIPRVKDFESIDIAGLRYLFSIGSKKFFLGDNIPVPKGFNYEPLRIFRRNNPTDLCYAGITGYHLYSWYRDNIYCGRCGNRMVHHDRMRAQKCINCGNTVFPKIAPAVIVGLVYKDSILISTYANREYKGRALLAGFCEIGETPEQTVEREVFEEVGLRVKSIRYFNSQPWGFDSNLLLGYFAKVDGDTRITMDEEELATAAFVSRDRLERDDNPISLTAAMINFFIDNKEKFD